MSASRGFSAPRRVVGFLFFAVIFLREVVLANFAVAKTVLLRSRRELHPGFLTYPLRDLTPFEVVVLTHCITLTPGTTSVEIREADRTLVVHALESRDPEAVRQSIRATLEAPLLRWTRP